MKHKYKVMEELFNKLLLVSLRNSSREERFVLQYLDDHEIMHFLCHRYLIANRGFCCIFRRVRLRVSVAIHAQQTRGKVQYNYLCIIPHFKTA